jgi:thiamine-phosphate pyrophosphorylase
MVIVISNPTSLKDEADLINQLFDEGLEIFHLRKPGSSLNELTLLLNQIDDRHHSKVSLHQHHVLNALFGLTRIHFTEEKRKQLSAKEINEFKENKIITSSSIHDQEKYETVSPHFDYVFLGPLFNSISKPGYKSIAKDDFRVPLARETKIIALGGIDNSKITKVKEYGFDGFAALGNIWKDSENAIRNFKKLKKEWEK